MDNHKRLGATFALLALLAFLSPDSSCSGAQTPLASLDYHIAGTFLQVSPSTLSVPTGIAGSILVSVVAGGSTNNPAVAKLTQGAYVQAVLRGPAFPTPQTIVSAPNAPLVLPPINLVGDYELDSIALIDATTGQVRMEGSPSTVPVNVFNQLLISTVTSTPLSLDQIQAAGIDIDESSFTAVQFNVSFVVNGQTIPVSFPVVSPTFTQSTELIPADEVQAQLQQAAVINQQISSTMVTLPPQLQTAGLNLQVQGLNFQVTDPGPGQSLSLPIPPIPAIMVIPGSIGYLHEFFSVQVFTENGAPLGSGLSVGDLEATLELPPGPDGIVSTNWADPGDDPLRFARVGSNDVTEPTQPVVDPGPDGILGDADDITTLQPGETGQANFLVEGLQEGLAVMNLNITGTLYGLAAGPVSITGTASGSVLVRNPSFSITFTHPDVVRVGEPYTASITVLNTGLVPANLVQVTLNQNSISGAMLASNQPQTIVLGTIPSGGSAVATYQMVSETTGQIEFSDLTTGDASVTGQFQFSMGVDAQGVPLSPDTIAMPDYVNSLPPDLLAAANRVLGQALSIATAAQLPPGIVPVDNAIITTRVLDLAEAGQRVQYGDPLYRVLPDLLRDWQGGRVTDDGFDSLVRTSDAGAQWRSTIIEDMEATDDRDDAQRAIDRAPDLAGLGQQFVLASANGGQLWVDFTGSTNDTTAAESSEGYCDVYPGTNGSWAVTPDLTNAVFSWTFTNGPSSADLVVLLVDTNGQAEQLQWQLPNPPPTAIYHFSLANGAYQLQADTNGDGVIDQTIPANQLQVDELPPTLVAVQQDLTVVAGRPAVPCVGPTYGNYGTVVAVVYSKPMTQASAGATNSYTVDGNNGADSVEIQPSGRVALLNLTKGVSAIIPRKMTITGVTDVRGNSLVASPTPIQCLYPGTTKPFTGGVAVTGRVLLGSGAPAIDVPVTLTMYDGQASDTGCQAVTRRVSQVLTDAGGNYSFDYVMSGIPYSISASDTTDLSSNALALIMESTISTQPDAGTLQQLISASSDPNSLLSLLSAGSEDQAVAIVEGLDRAVVNDSVAIGSSREGQTVPIVLQFRGRGTVTGQVVASDGVTPVPNAAVNLYPDPSSLELGRGVYADETGSFTFNGIPLGVFTINVATSDQRGATVAGVLTAPGQTTNVVIALPDNPVYYGTLEGTVYDSDNITPIANASVYVGHYNGTTMNGVVAIVTTDINGSWDATNVPIASWDVAAVTFDGTRDGVRQNITPLADQPTYVDISLQAATTVYGQVQYDNGQGVSNALVAGGSTLVYTDGNGNFQLQGVPVGSATISAGLEANPAAGIPFTRLGSTSANIIAGTANYVVVRLNAAGQIYGKVFDSQGNIQPNITVAIPDPEGGGFYYTQADTNGNYSFPNLSLGNYTLSAPANATSPQLDQSSLSAQLSSGDESEILAAYQEAVTVFVGADDPLINGDDLNFAPSAWGYTTANLNYDGASVEADIHFIPQGSISGTVLNGQGIPIGAEVELTGIGPDPTGMPVMTVRGTMDSDVASGAFGFTNVLLAGPWGLQAASPFYPTVIQTNGFTTVLDLNVSGIVLKFPPVNDVNGSIAGYVYNPDGTPAGSNVQVHISVAPNYQIETDSNGFFNTQTEFPAENISYEVDALDPSTGLQGRSFVAMTAGITNFVNVQLLSRDASIQVTVVRADGGPASGAQLEVDQNTYPFDPPIYGVADTNGVADFTGLWTGSYSVIAQYIEGSTQLMARGGVSVSSNQMADLTLTMGATGTIEGTFVKQDGVTPVVGANVTIGNLGLASTSTNGYFEFDGVPLGSYTITSSDPVTGANAVTSANVNYNGDVAVVQLVEGTLGTVNGFVLDPFSSNFVANASVTISFDDGITPSRTVTSGPNGSFSFPGSPMGGFNLSANYSIPGALNFVVSGQASGVLSLATNTTTVDIQLQPLSDLTVQVFRPDGATPAQNVLVTVNGTQQNTSSNGTAFFNNLPVPATYSVTAISQLGGDLADGAQTNVTLSTRGTAAFATLVLPGVGYITGTVVASDGVTPVDNADVTFQSQNPLFGQDNLTALSDPQGHFSFNDVPLSGYLLTAVTEALAASQNGTLTTNGQTNVVVLQLGASGTIMGEVVRADGVTPVGGEEILIQYNSQSSNPGRATYLTSTNGLFQFNNVPLGPVQISSAAPDFDGIINLTAALTNNGEVLNLGVIPYDETYPQVSEVIPTNNSIGVSISNAIELFFSKALDSNSVNASGIFLQDTNGGVAATVTLGDDTNNIPSIVTITPDVPLQSLTTYSVIVLAGDLYGAEGGIIGSGPTDLYGRALAAPFESDFTTADQTPPVLLSMYPTNNQVQVPVAAVPRLVFNKSLNPSNYVFTMTGPSGPVAGTASLGINGQVLTFEPTVDLLPNAVYSIAISNVYDLAGNYAVGQPYLATFATLVTVGPSIASLQIASNAVPFAGSTIPVIAVLATNKAGDTVAFTQDFNAIGTVSNAPYQIMVTLPSTGSTTIRAIPTDQYGNAGQYVSLTIPVQFPAPPTVAFAGTFDDGLGQPLRTNYWTMTQTTPGLYSVTFSNWLMNLAWAQTGNVGGLQNVGPSLTLSNVGGPVTGDFSVQTSFTNAALPGPGLDQVQLNVEFQDGSVFLDVLDNVSGGEAHVWTGSANGSISYTNTYGTFRVARANGVLTGYVNGVPLYSESNTNAVTSIQLVLQNNNAPSDPTAVSFYDFALTGASVQSQPAPPGSLVAVEVNAITPTSLSNFTAIVGGAASGSLASTNGHQLLALGYVPTNATPYQPVQVFAQVTDGLGQSSGQSVLTIPVVDTVAPTLTILSPANESHPASGPSFNVTSVVSDNSSNVTLSLAVTGSFAYSELIPVTLTPNVSTTNVLTVPLAAAPTNGGPIVVTLTATDAASNTTVAARTLWLPNTPGPQIASLAIASNLPPVAGLTVPILATLATNMTGNVVVFTQDGVSLGTFTNAPYQVEIKLPATGSTTITAVATDPFGNVGLVSELVITVEQNVAPTIQFVRVTPATGAIPTGTAFTVDVNASGDKGEFDITAGVGGAANGAAFQTTGTTLVVAGFVPSNAIAGQQVQITAQAVDGLGQSSGPQLLQLPVADGTPPTIAILDPPPNAQLTPSEALPLTVAVGDNSSNVTLQITLSGSNLNTSQNVALLLTPNLLETNVINVTLPNEPTNGSAVIATVVATDQAGNSTTTTRLFWLPGTDTTVTWDRQALGQSFSCSNGGGYSWPNDNNWSQSQVLGTPCGGDTPVVIQPSNWSATNAPDATNLDVVLGGLGGAPVNLDISVSVHSVTIESNGGLNFVNNTILQAVNYYFQGDGATTRNGSAGMVLAGGTMEKTAGTNTFTIEPGTVLNSSGGTVAVDSGTLALPGDNSYYSNGVFNASSNATLLLAPQNNQVTMAGTFTGSGAGNVLFNAGTIVGNPSATFDLTGGLFQWNGGVFAGAINNSGTMNLTTNDGIMANQSLFFNSGLFRQAEGGRLGFLGNGGGTTAFYNLAGATYEFATNTSMYVANCCGTIFFQNQGLLIKDGGTNASSVGIDFNNLGGTVEVTSGQLTLNSGSSSNGTLLATAGTSIDLTGGGSATWAGQITGGGSGQTLLSSGTMIGSPGVTLAFSGDFFQWSGGSFAGVMTNTGVLDISGPNNSLIDNQSTLYNAGTVKHMGSGALGYNGNGGGLTAFYNLPGGIYNLMTDSAIYENNCCGTVLFQNQGLFLKSGGTGDSIISVGFNNLGGTVQVNSGELALSYGSSSNGTLIAASGATLNVTGGNNPTWAGSWTGSGDGQVVLSQGTISASPNATLAFTNDLFQWSGGVFAGVVTNQGIVDLTGSSDSILANQAFFINAGIVKHRGSGRLGLNGNGGGTTAVINLPGATYEFATNSSVFANDCCGTLIFQNQGLLIKDGGTNASGIDIDFNNLGGTVQVTSGELTLNSGSSSNGTLIASPGTILDLTGGGTPTWAGQMTGGGGGAVALSSGTLVGNPGVTLAFTNDLFQWSGGAFAGVMTNVGILDIAGGSPSILLNQASFYNDGTVRQGGSGGLGMNGNGGGTTGIYNLAGGVYQFTNDSRLFVNNCCGSTIFDNQGKIWKSGGTNTTAVDITFNNLGGIVQVDSGQLAFQNGGSSSGGTFLIAAGASVDLTGGSTATWTGEVNGSGGGAVLLSDGILVASPALSLNFASNVFQWGGGGIAGIVTNTGMVTLNTGNNEILLNQSAFYNAGLVVQSGTGSLGYNGDGGGTTAFYNLPGATYNLAADSGIYVNNCCGTTIFNNQGLLRKSAGTNTSTVSVSFANAGGSLEVDSGTLNLQSSPYAQAGGAFTVQLNGTNAGQSGQLQAGNVTLNGPLNLKLAPGYVPPVGAQFLILAGSSVTGTFSSLNVPAGISISYSGNQVVASVTNQVTGQLVVQPTQPKLTIARNGGAANLQWNGVTNFSLEESPSLGEGALWAPVTNIPLSLSNGVYEISLPVSNAAQYFRLRQH